MKHSPKYEMVKKFYKVYKVWSLDRVRDAVEKGWITEDEFKELTGEDNGHCGRTRDTHEPEENKNCENQQHIQVFADEVFPDERRQSNQTHQPKARNNYAQKAQETCG